MTELFTEEDWADIAMRTLTELERIHSFKIDAIMPDGTHRYWSTHCRHGNHEACSATTITGSGTVLRGARARRVRIERPVSIERKPAQCKTCAAPCVCPCHQEVSGG